LLNYNACLALFAPDPFCTTIRMIFSFSSHYFGSILRANMEIN